MSLWGNTANSKPKFLNSTGTYYNINNCEGVTVADTANTDLTAGWTQIHYRGAGGVSSVDVNAGGTGYANTDVVTVTSADGKGTGAAFSITANANGAITAVTVTANGSGYINPPILTVSGGTGARLWAHTSGRKTYEPLVAISTIH